MRRRMHQSIAGFGPQPPYLLGAQGHSALQPAAVYLRPDDLPPDRLRRLRGLRLLSRLLGSVGGQGRVGMWASWVAAGGLVQQRAELGCRPRG